MGKKKQPFYRIVAADSRTRRDGKYIDKIGHYNPITNPAEIVINEEKAFYWLKNGAIPTDTVKNLFSQKGIMLKWHYIRDGHEETKVEEEYKKWELLQLEKQKREEALAAQAKREQKPEIADEEPVQEVKEEVVAEAKAEPLPETDPDSLSEQSPETVEPQLESETPEQEAKESQPEEQNADTQPTNDSDEAKDK